MTARYVKMKGFTSLVKLEPENTVPKLTSVRLLEHNCSSC